MPTVFRTMWEDDGKPSIGQTSNCLGVRSPPAENPDISPVGEMVEPRMGGMSVAPHWTKLPFFLIPKHLEHIIPRARAKTGMRCFRLGAGAFEDGEIADELTLRVENERHGLIEPTRRMLIDDYQSRLAETKDMWSLDESHE